jgi:hypothetical protein
MTIGLAPRRPRLQRGTGFSVGPETVEVASLEVDDLSKPAEPSARPLLIGIPETLHSHFKSNA